MDAYRSQKDDWFGYALNGGASENRTHDLLLAKQTFYQLNYDPIGATDRTRTCNLRITSALHYQLCYRGIGGKGETRTHAPFLA